MLEQVDHPAAIGEAEHAAHVVGGFVVRRCAGANRGLELALRGREFGICRALAQRQRREVAAPGLEATQIDVDASHGVPLLRA